MNRPRSSSPTQDAHKPVRYFRKLAAISLVFGMSALVLGCPKKAAPIDLDSGPPPVPTPSVTQTTLQPLDDTDAGEVDAGVDAGKKKTGTGQTASQAHVKQCCSALHAQAKAMNNDPTFTSFAQLCDGLAPQVGPSSGGQAPELEPLRQLLKGKPTIPAICQGL